MKILIITAMDAERDAFLKNNNYEVKLINGFPTYYLKNNDKELYLAKTDVGKVNAAILTTLLITKIKPRYVINAGICGALTDKIKILDCIVATKTCYHDFDLTLFGLPMGALLDHDLYYKASPRLINAAPKECIRGLIVSGDQFISKGENLVRIKTHFKKAIGCDMEGNAIMQTVETLGRKGLVIRVVSDYTLMEDHHDNYFDYKPKACEKVAKLTYELISNL